MSAALKKSPLTRVKDEFGGKDKLVDKIVGVLDAGDESKDDLRKRLLGVANSKLIRLHTVATQTKTAGGHDKLVASTAERLNRGKDKDYVTRLDGFSDARLLDVLSVAERKAKAAAAKPAAAPKAKAAQPPKAKAAKPAKPAAAKATKTAAKTAAKKG
jgi:pyruvate/2-oxoglutarate dehydrogenase complex dihydrolipoamide acyltransferase (E2) component